jgi:hypothetical protein
MVTLSQGSLSVQLRSPDFGNSDSIEIRRISRTTRGGQLIIFRDPQWPKTRTFKVKFSYLKQSDLDNLLDFIYRTVGQNVTYTDHDGRSWTGIILTPGEEVSQPGREDYSAQFTFQVQL